MVLDVDSSKRRISLGLKQVQRNPWEEFTDTHPVGSTSRARCATSPSSACSSACRRTSMAWSTCPTSPGTSRASWRWPSTRRAPIVRAKVLDIDVEKERISLGIKQLQEDPAADTLSRVNKGEVVTCIVTAIQANGIEVKVDDVLTGFIRRAELARDKCDQRPDRFAVGEKVDAKITGDRPRRPQALAHHQGPRDRGGQAGGGRVRHVGQRRVAGRHPGCGDPSPQSAAGRVSWRTGLEADLLLDRRRLKRRLVFLAGSRPCCAPIGRRRGAWPRRTAHRGRQACRTPDGQRRHHPEPQADRSGGRARPRMPAWRR